MITLTPYTAHPNIRVLITSCDTTSMMEAVHYGVPVLALPFTRQQKQNAEYLVMRELAVLIDWKINYRALLENTNLLLSEP